MAVDFWRIAKLAEKNLKLHSSMIALGLTLHGWLLVHDVFAGAGINLGFFLALSAILWLTVLIYWLVNLKHPLYSLQAVSYTHLDVYKRQVLRGERRKQRKHRRRW